MIRWFLCWFGFHNWKSMRSIEITDKEGKITIGILFICPDCSKYRFFITNMTKHNQGGIE